MRLQSFGFIIITLCIFILQSFQKKPNLCPAVTGSPHFVTEVTKFDTKFLVAFNEVKLGDYIQNGGFNTGQTIFIVRCFENNRFETIAEGSIQRKQMGIFEATVTPSLGLQKEPFPTITSPMVGDYVIPSTIFITQRNIITPNIVKSNEELFIQYGVNNFGFDLSPSGQQEIKTLVEKMGPNQGRLMIEAYSLRKGNSDRLRIETLVRAQTIAAYIMEIFPIPDHQIIPLGYGNEWLKDRNIPREAHTIDGVRFRILVE